MPYSPYQIRQFTPASMTQTSTLLATPQERQHLVDEVLRYNKNTAVEPSPVEKMLLEWYVLGELTLDQMLSFLDAASQKEAISPAG